jgi:hypothetical protein
VGNVLFYIVTRHQKNGIVEPEETAVAGKRRNKHLSMAVNMHATTEQMLEAVFSIWFMPSPCSKGERDSLVKNDY